MRLKLKRLFSYTAPLALLLTIGTVQIVSASTLLSPVKVAAAPAAGKCADGTDPPKKGDVTSCPAQTVSDPALNNTKCPTVAKCDLVQGYINPFINFLAALVGVAVVISIVIGGIQYSSSGGDPAKAAAAKNRIRNAIVALVAFFFLYALLNFLIPGGLL
jgi:hypothetical protein